MCREKDTMPSLCSEEETGNGGPKCAPTPLTMPSVCSPITLKFTDVSYGIQMDDSKSAKGSIMLWSKKKNSSEAAAERTILSGVTGIVRPGEILAILGPSGSGKSTLLNVLGGRLQGKYTGTVTANGGRVTRSVLRRTGFVTQDDVLYPHLTVKETLVFCSLLRLPNTLSKAEKIRAAESVISELGLGKCEDTIIGNGFIRGVSGGERKRVSIGHEMLVNPSLLLLDEPTSGLDSTAAHRLVSTLAGLAGKGKAVVTSVHQPSSQVYQMFDSVLLLSEGTCIYFGKGRDAMDYFASAGFVPRFPMNPADFMLDLANGVSAQSDCHHGDMEKTTVKQTLISSYNILLAPKTKAVMETRTTAGEPIPIGSQRNGEEQEQKKRQDRGTTTTSWLTQFSILLQRGLKERRHETFNTLRVIQVVSAAVLAGSMWWRSDPSRVRDRLGLLFFVTIFWGVFPSFNAAFTFPQERALFAKERASAMYSLSSYFLARTAADLPMEFALPALFITVLYWMAGLRPDPAAFLLTAAVLLGYVLVAQGLGLALGAAIMDAKRASTVVTVTMLAFLLTGGFYVHNVPGCLEWVRYTSFTYYCYGLLVRVQYGGRREMGHLMSQVGREMEGQVGAVVSVVALLVMFVGYRLLAYAALRRIKA